MMLIPEGIMIDGTVRYHANWV